MNVLIDTGFLFALEVKKDKYHEKANELSNNLKLDLHSYCTSSLVVNETYTLMNARTKGMSMLLISLIDYFGVMIVFSKLFTF
jgi:predicted nucleic acid-binding protein